MPQDPVGRPLIWDAQVEQLDEAESLRLISGGGVGRIAYSSRLGLAVLPVSYRMLDGSIVVRIPLGSTLDEDLRTGIRGADYKVTFEIDQVGKDIDEGWFDGWFVVIQGPAHHVDSHDDCLAAWVPAPQTPDWRTREHFVCIKPSLIVGRRLSREDGGNLLHRSGTAGRSIGSGWRPWRSVISQPA
jgi:nitroimidazol reductase NimA-like FMN-containing flavoprotein (pyridoxamine 5'-phosphate oxidase superfamily)